MGQNVSSEFNDFFSSIFEEEFPNSLLSYEIRNLTYEELLSRVKQLNLLSEKYQDVNGKQLLFVVKKNIDSSSILWKAMIQIACVKVDSKNKIENVRLLDLTEFIKVYKTLLFQCNITKEENVNKIQQKLPTSTLFENIEATVNKTNQNESESQSECCICFERVPETLLPCAHAYCSKCIGDWNVSHDTCPICREKLESCDDTWVLSEIPNVDEVREEIRANLMSLTDEKPTSCSFS